MITGQCITNLDKYSKVVWPKVFSGIPNKGDSVEGYLNKEFVCLKIIEVTHGVRMAKSEVTRISSMIPTLKILLSE